MKGCITVTILFIENDELVMKSSDKYKREKLYINSTDYDNARESAY